MEPLTYHHLHYFWVVARTGTIAQAGEQLQLSQPTISTQLKKLEESLGQALFRKAGRRLELTEVGLQVYRYADRIFTLGEELQRSVQQGRTGFTEPLALAVAEELPQPLAQRLLQPLIHLDEVPRLHCRRGAWAQLLGDLAIGRVAAILSDQSVTEHDAIRAHSHPLGGTGVSLFGDADLVRHVLPGFPRSLGSVPWVLPAEGRNLRGLLNQWLDRQALRPPVLAEFDDAAAMYDWARNSHSIVAAVSILEPQLEAQWGLVPCGRLEDEVMVSLFLTTLTPEWQHPALDAIAVTARRDLGGSSATSSVESGD